MTTLLARLVEDQPLHPPWCATDHGENNSHAGQYVLVDAWTGIDPATGDPVVSKVGVMVIQGSRRPLVWISTRAYLPEDARAIAGLLCVLGHAVLAAAITRAVGMAEA